MSLAWCGRQSGSMYIVSAEGEYGEHQARKSRLVLSFKVPLLTAYQALFAGPRIDRLFRADELIL
jgi:hypothetical protein